MTTPFRPLRCGRAPMTTLSMLAALVGGLWCGSPHAQPSPPSVVPTMQPAPSSLSNGPIPGAGSGSGARRALIGGALAVGLWTLWRTQHAERPAGTEPQIQRPGDEAGPQREEPEPNPQDPGHTPCPCDKLAIGPALAADGTPEVGLSGAVSAAQPSILEVTIDAKWLAEITCGKGQGECAGSADVTLAPRVTIGGKATSLVPGKGQDAPAKGGRADAPKPLIGLECRGPCERTSSATLSTKLVIGLARGQLVGTRDRWSGSGGHINERKDAIAGTIGVTITPKGCAAGAGTTLILELGGTGRPQLKSVTLVGDLPRKWIDRDGDGRIDADPPKRGAKGAEAGAK